MSARKTRTLREKIFNRLFYHTVLEYQETTDLTKYILRLVRDEQRKKCKKCLEQTVKNIWAREMERLNGGPK